MMGYQLLLVCSLLLVCAGPAFSQGDDCLTASTCSQCLLAGPQCYWCYQEDNVGCYALGSNRTCESDSRYRPLSKIDVEKNDSVGEAVGDRQAIQLAPQELDLELVPHQAVSFEAAFRMSAHFPVDLYYLMDLSNSMSDDKKKLIDLSALMAEALQRKTTQLHVGFGAFVEKPVSPFISIQPEKIGNPCFPGKTCVPVYGYKNILPLTSDLQAFATGVEDAKLSSNIDNPEGGFDALMQALVCTEAIGWRPNARRIIVMATDAPPHIAMDGKLAGIILPNDENCHTDTTTGEYDETYSKTFDYPSLGQIGGQIKKKIVNLIFAVTASKRAVYDGIKDVLPNSIVGTLSDDSSNIVTLLEDNYDEIFSTVSLETLTLPSGLDVAIRPLCPTPVLNGTSCEVSVGTEVKFEVTVTLESCDGASTGSFDIFPSGVDEKLTVNFTKMCGCTCGKREEQSPQCNGQGALSCGSCECYPGYKGSKCSCAPDSRGVTNPGDTCRRTPGALQCSGQGLCDECGACQCECVPGQSGVDCVRYSGPFCQCNPNACGNSGQGLCSGRGQCQCDSDGGNTCLCETGFFGDDCQCSRSMDSCRSGGGGVIAERNSTLFSGVGMKGDVCEGHGLCECLPEEQRCRCIDPCYSGDFCHVFNETSYECFIEKKPVGEICSQLQGCVACFIDKQNLTGCEEFCSVGPDQTMFEIQPVDDVFGGCEYPAKDGCIQRFAVESDRPFIRYKKELECVSYLWLIGLVIGVFLLGLLLLLAWKCVVTMKDRREFERFEKDRLEAKWPKMENPIFSPAVTTVKNPMYAKESNGNGDFDF